MLFTQSLGDTIALKSEYRNDSGDPLCYIVGSGETYWGGVDHKRGERLSDLLVFAATIDGSITQS